MIKKIVITTLTLLLGFPAIAEEVDKTIDAAKDGQQDLGRIAGQT